MKTVANLLQNDSLKRAAKAFMTPVQRHVTGPIVRIRNRSRARRCLELGPGFKRIEGFETVNIEGGPRVDYVADVIKPLPFEDGSFDIVYASHILEHLPWYLCQSTLRDWSRILKPGGQLEVWVPDGLKIAEAFVAAENKGCQNFKKDGWWRFNRNQDPCDWASGRLFSYGDGNTDRGHFNWHHALFSERRLMELLCEAGLNGVRRMKPGEVRGYDHGWINLGVAGRKGNHL